MTSLLRKKHQTTPPNTLRTTNSSAIASAAIVACLLAAAEACGAADSLQWGEPTSQSVKAAGLVYDSQVVVAAWDEADAAVQSDRSVVVKRTTDYDPFEETDRLEDHRFAQRPDIHHEEEDESLDLFGEEPEQKNLDAAQDALEDELERRQSVDDSGSIDLFQAEEPEEYDLFDDPAKRLQRDGLDQGSIDQQDPFEDTPLESEEAENDTDEGETSDDASSELFEKMTVDEDGILERHDLDDESDEQNTYEDSDQWLDLDMLQPGTEELTEQQRKLLDEERVANEESCLEEIEKLRAQRLENIDLSIRVEGNAGEDYPFECSLEDEQLKQRHWPQITYMWKASGLCHKPLYFEQTHLERHGHSWGPCIQPLLSGVHFFGTIPVLPYCMGIKTPNECVYTLGHYRPGDCAPYMIDAVPFTWRAAAFQAGTATGLPFLVP